MKISVTPFQFLQLKVDIITQDVDKIGSEQILIKSKYSLISPGTELARFRGIATPIISGKLIYPLYNIGYSNIGVISKCGRNVKHFKEGDIVYSQANHALYNIVNVKSANVCKLPENVPLRDASFTTLAAVALYGIRRSNIQLGSNVGIIGQGIVGQFAIQLARLSGAIKPIALDVFKKRLELSKISGAGYVLNIMNLCERNIIDKLREINNGHLLNILIDATGNPSALVLALKTVAKRGRIVVIGSPHGAVEINPCSELHFNDISLIGAFQPNNPVEANIIYPWTQVEERKLILLLMKEKLLKSEHLISREYHYSDAFKAYNELINDKDILGVIFNWDKR